MSNAMKVKTAQMLEDAGILKNSLDRYVIDEQFALLPQLATYAAGDNVHFELEGTGAADADATHAVGGGVVLTADSGGGSADDEAILVLGANQSVTFDSDHQPVILAKITTPATLTETQYKIGFASDAAGGAVAAGADGSVQSDTSDVECVFTYDTDDSDTTWQVNFTNAATAEVEVDTGITVDASTDYYLMVRVNADRTVDYFIQKGDDNEGVLVYTSTALDNAEVMGPIVGVSGLSAADRTLTVRRLVVSKNHTD